MKSKILFLFTLFSILSPLSVMADSKVACKDWANNNAKDRAIAAEQRATAQQKAVSPKSDKAGNGA